MSYDNNDADQDFIKQAMPAFISEAAEQIEAIETLLLELEEQPDNRELLDSLFRCAHTVKGSAGIFGLNRVVEFTHHVETLLDKMRDGDIALNPTISTLLLQCNDQIKFLVDTAADEGADTPEIKDQRADLVMQLKALTEGQAPLAAPAPAASATSNASATSATGTPAPGLRIWSISARFGQETFRNGMDPLSIARYLATLGRVVTVRCGADAAPRSSTSTPRAAT
jgi:two-component system chemotaxis sensor kinase CheA